MPRRAAPAATGAAAGRSPHAFAPRRDRTGCTRPRMLRWRRPSPAPRSAGTSALGGPSRQCHRRCRWWRNPRPRRVHRVHRRGASGSCRPWTTLLAMVELLLVGPVSIPRPARTWSVPSTSPLRCWSTSRSSRPCPRRRCSAEIIKAGFICDPRTPGDLRKNSARPKGSLPGTHRGRRCGCRPRSSVRTSASPLCVRSSTTDTPTVTVSRSTRQMRSWRHGHAVAAGIFEAELAHAAGLLSAAGLGTAPSHLESVGPISPTARRLEALLEVMGRTRRTRTCAAHRRGHRCRHRRNSHRWIQPTVVDRNRTLRPPTSRPADTADSGGRPQ